MKTKAQMNINRLFNLNNSNVISQLNMGRSWHYCPFSDICNGISKESTPNFTIPFAIKSCFKLNNFHKKCMNSLKYIYILKTSNSIKLGKLASYGTKSIFK